MNFTPVDNSGRVDGFCLIKTVDKKTSSKGDSYLDMTLTDSDGEINAKLWRYNPAEHGEYKANEIVKIRGTVSEYNGSDQLRIERIRTANDADNINIEDFVPTADYSSAQMYDEIIRIASEFEDEELKKLLTSIYEDNRKALLYWPAAFKLHHAVRGGLLMHTLSIVRMCEDVCRLYPFVDRDLLICGAMLHDISKTEEFIVSESTGLAEGYSVQGNLLGHLTMGAKKVAFYAEKLGISEEKSMLVQHMILSHHGVPEFGAAVMPMFIEAELLSELDLLDSRIYEMREALLNTNVGEFSQRVWALDNRKLYNHGRKDLKNEKVKLF